MTNPDEIRVAVKVGRRTGYAIYSATESVHATNDSNTTWRVYDANGTYVMHVAGWQIEKMRIE